MSNTDAIRQWVADRTGLTTIWLHPDAPRPARPFASVQVLSSPRLGEPHIDWPDVDGIAEVAGQTETTFSIQIYEAADNPDPRGALQRAIALRDSLDLPSVRAFFRENQWAFRASHPGTWGRCARRPPSKKANTPTPIHNHTQSRCGPRSDV